MKPLPFIFIIFFSGWIQAENICSITVPIGTWFRNHTGPCDIVKGHFILDRLANVFAWKLTSVFGGLKSIEGCLYVKGFTGTTDLSFFGNLKSVVCKKKHAAEANLTNVIEVVGPSLKTMGFNSLEKVEGPGRIILSFDEVQKSYRQMEQGFYEPERGKKCFSKEEMQFLARNLQFQGKMYRPCDDITDPCFNLNPWNKTTWEGNDEDYYWTDGPIVWHTARDLGTLPPWYPRTRSSNGVMTVTRSPIQTDSGPSIDEIIRTFGSGTNIIRSGDGMTITRTVTTGKARRIARDTSREWRNENEPDNIARTPKRYKLSDIPNNCPTFVGAICLFGPLTFEGKDLGRFANLTLLIGQIHMSGTLFDDLQSIFPNLQMVYPYEAPGGFSDSCNSEIVPDLTNVLLEPSLAPRGEALQVIRVRLNRFMKNLSLPFLEPTRPLDLSNPYYQAAGLSYLFVPAFFPEPIEDVCSHFPKFRPGDCGRFLDNVNFEEEVDFEHPEQKFIQLGTLLLIAIGVAFCVRAMILLQFSNASVYLPYSRGFIIFAVFVLILSALENCIVRQKMFNVDDNVRQVPQIMLEFDSHHLTHPFSQFIMAIIVSTKYTCLLLIIFCYIDVILFYRLKSLRLTRYFFILATILAVLLCIYLHSQIFITIRGREPNYTREPRHVVYMPFIMNKASVANFTLFLPDTRYLTFIYELLVISFNDQDGSTQSFHFDQVMLEIHGNIFPDFSFIADIGFAVAFLVFYLLSYRGAIHPHSKFFFLVLLYFQLSINRLRYYIYSLLVDDYCLRKDIWTKDDDYMGPYYTCYTQMFSYRKMKQRGDIIMEEYVWKIIEQILVVSPNVTFAATSFVCWKFARYASYLGPALQFREHRNETTNSDGYNPANPSDCPPSYQKM